MRTNKNFYFWKEVFVEKFELNNIGIDLLDMLSYQDVNIAKTYILEKFNERFKREDIIEMFSQKYTIEHINMILEDLLEKKLTQTEIKNLNMENVENFVEKEET